MILFEHDWQYQPSALPHYETGNEHFLHLVAKYRDMGVRNCLFPLALINPALRDVDPHDPNLSAELKLLVGAECDVNPWYFLREVVRIPPIAGPIPIKYKCNRGNIALTWAFLCNVDIALIQPRQTGKSVSTDCIMVWLIFFGASNSKINMITKDDVLRKANVERLKRIRDLLPKYLINRSRDDTDNQFEIKYSALDNLYLTGVSQNSESAANNLGRGLSAPISHIDEGPFIKFIGITLPAALASGNKAREEAEEYGKPYGNIFTTTAGKKDDRDGKYMYDWIHGGAVWTERFFDCSGKTELNEMIKNNRSGRKQIINATFSHRQLGLTDQWLYEAMANAGATGEAADRDFFNVWTSGTQSSPLSPALNELIRNSRTDVLENEITKDLYMIRWYIPEEEIETRMATGDYILGLDTSEAVGRDSIGGVIIDSRDLGVVAAFTCNETNLIRFAGFLADIMIRFERVILVPERKSTGGMIIDHLLQILPRHGIDPFRRIYSSIVDEASERPEEYKEICQGLASRAYDFYDVRRKYMGFKTDANLRLVLYSTVLQNAAKKSGHLVRDKILAEEITALVVKKGRIDHEASGHDDHVVAWLLAQWFITMSKNLQHYGIDQTRALSAVSSMGREMGFEEVFFAQQQRLIKAEIDQLSEELAGTTDIYAVARLEARLKQLGARVQTDEREAVSVDALITQAREKRDAASFKSSRNRQGLDRGQIWRSIEGWGW